MWALILSGLLVGATVSASDQDAWNKGILYDYEIEAKALTALQEVQNQFAGVQIIGNVLVQVRNSTTVAFQLKNMQVAEVHQNLSGGWASEIPDDQLSYVPLKLKSSRFNLKYSDGVITNVTFSRKSSVQEMNFLKGLASAFQLDIQSALGQEEQIHYPNSGVYTTMEAVVTGECLTEYTYGPYAKYAALSDDDLRLENWRDYKNLLTVKKSVNFTECEKRVGYHFGLNSLTYWEPVENTLGRTYSRSSNTEAVLSGSPLNYTIQKSVVTNQVILNPLLYSQQKGMLGSQVKVALKTMKVAPIPLPPITDPITVEDLVYTFPNMSSLQPHKASDQLDSEEDSGSSSDQSEDLVEAYSVKKRYRRVADSDESESDSESDEDEYSPSVPEPDVVHAPFLPFYEHLKAQPLPEVKNDVNALIVKIAQEIREPNTIPSNETLASFQILSKKLLFYDLVALLQVANKFYAPYPSDRHSESQALRYSQWVVLINAIAQSGSGPSVQAINELFKLNKLRGQLAANAIGKFPYSALFPNAKYINAFFQLVRNTEDHSPENSTAALAFGNLLRLSAVNRQSAHNRYPVHYYGKLSAPSEAELIRYVGYFGAKLREAVKNADSIGIQVYTRALGNIGHSQVIDVLRPYLLGQKRVSNFQRLLMVLALDQVAQLHPQRTSPLLIQIYQSTGETHQIRSAAVLLLMGTNPSSTVLKRIAQFTNQDPSPQVVSVVKTAIQSATRLTSPENLKLANSAKAAVDLLNPNKTAVQYSAKHLQDYIVRGMALSYYLKASQIGSRDTLIPNGLYSGLQLNIGGFKHLSGEVQSAVSSVKDLKDLLQYIIVESGEKNEKPSRNVPLKKIITDLKQQLEGQLGFNIISYPSIVAFDNNTILAWVDAIRGQVSNLEKGVPFNETQLVKSVDVRIAFPNALGLPSYIDYQSPVLYSIGGELRLKTSPRLNSAPHRHLAWPQIVNASADIQVVYSRRTSGNVGFHIPALNKNFAAGFVKNYQIQAPIRIAIDIDGPNNATYVRLQPIDKDYRYQLAHSSSVPYTRIFKYSPAAPVLEEEDTQIIHIRKPRSWKQSYGKNVTGMVYSIDYQSEKEFDDSYSAYKRMQDNDALSAVLFSQSEYEIYASNISLYYEPKQSISKAVELSASYVALPMPDGEPSEPKPEVDESEDEDEDEDEESESEDEENQEEYSRRKRGAVFWPLRDSEFQNSVLSSDKVQLDAEPKQLLRRLPSPGKNFTLRVLKAEVRFVKQRGAALKLQVYSASSPVDSRSEILGLSELILPLAKEPYQAVLNLQANYPSVPFMNLEKALKSDPNATVRILFAAGQGSFENGMRLLGQLNIGRSHSWLQQVQRSGIASVCRAQMRRLNNVLQACRNATIAAGSMNNYELALKYSDVPYQVSNLTYALFSALRQAGYIYVTENAINSTAKPGQLRASLLVAPDLHSLNASLSVQKMDAWFTNVRLTPAVAKALITHPLIPRPQRVANYLTNWQYNASCSVDISAIKTFDNRTYIYKPTSECWKILLITAPERDVHPSLQVQRANVTVLTRRIAITQREVKILVDDNEIYLVFKGGKYILRVNKQYALISQKYVTTMRDNHGRTLVVAYGLPDSVRVETSGLILYFDQQRLLLQADNSYRRQVRGLCGTFDGQTVTDFKLPQNCIVRNVTAFIHAYTTPEGCSVPVSTSEVPKQCYKEEIIVGNGTVQRLPDPQCIVYRHRVVFRDQKICISRKQLPACSLKCDPIDLVNKVVPFRCYSRKEKGVQKLVEKVKQGGRVNVDSIPIEGENVNLEVSIPTSCERNLSLSEEE